VEIAIVQMTWKIRLFQTMIFQAILKRERN
jgi:hypothetical protein